jgi:predicted aldo/keto reductase-like oxidoreductase
MLTPQELSTISEVKDFYQSRIKVNCTDCKYCMPCPHGVNIPGCFFFYNNASIFNDKENFKKYYISQLKEESRAEMCQECGICETKCPQGIEIINQLKAVHEYFNG